MNFLADRLDACCPDGHGCGLWDGIACLWPGHALAKEAGELEQTVLLAKEVHGGAEVRTAQYASDRMAAEKRAEAAEARVAELDRVLAEAPEVPPLGSREAIDLWAHDYRMWRDSTLARREAALEGK